MWLRNTSIGKWWHREVDRLSLESVIYRVLGRICVKGRYPFDDRARPLQHNPLGMFFYNLRAIFLGSSAVFLMVLALLVWRLPSTEQTRLTFWILAGTWLLVVCVTLILHHFFLKSLESWVSKPIPNELPPMFDWYFLLDFTLIYLIILIGYIWRLGFEHFVVLLLANMIVYGAYGGERRRAVLLIPEFLFILLVVPIAFFPRTTGTIAEPDGFHISLYLGPLLSTLVVTGFSVRKISWLRTDERLITERYLELLGKYERILSGTVNNRGRGWELSQEPQNTLYFRERVKKVLEDLCSLGEPFWYKSACLWFIEENQERGKLLLPGPRIKFDEADKHEDGIEVDKTFLCNTQFILLHSSQYHFAKDNNVPTPMFRCDLDAPTGFIPLSRGERQIGGLAVYGEEGGPLMRLQDVAFLWSLGSIFSSTLERSEQLYKTSTHQEMNDLFKCESLEELFPQVVKILKRYLSAAGCMVVFRPDSNKPEMEIVAREGFSDVIFQNIYTTSGKGMTAKCVQSGETIRVNDVSKHKEIFDQGYLDCMEKAHGGPIRSWMAIPIGSKNKNYGAIKVVNREYRCSWFTSEDQKLGEEFAIRLQVIIEKFLYIKQKEAASEAAQRQSEKAISAQRKTTLSIELVQLAIYSSFRHCF